MNNSPRTLLVLASLAGAAGILVALGAQARQPSPPGTGVIGLKPSRAHLEQADREMKVLQLQIAAAVALWHKGDRTTAERRLAELTRGDPLHAESALANLYEGAGELAKAYPHWRRLLLSKDVAIFGTGSSATALHVADLAARYGTPAEHLALLREAAGSPRPPSPTQSLDPGLDFDVNDPRQLRAAALLGVGGADPKHMIDTTLEALRLRPDWADAYYYLGERLSIMGRQRESVLALRQAASFDSGASSSSADALLRHVSKLAEGQEGGALPDRTPHDGTSLYDRIPALRRFATPGAAKGSWRVTKGR